MARMETGWRHPRDELVETMRRIYRHKMTTTSGGNLSILDPDGGIWITPSRVDKGGLQASDIVYVGADGAKTGLHAPSSEFPFHREIYRRRPDLRAIVHAHPGALVAFSICRRLPETRVQVLAHAICGKVAYAPYACPGSEQLGRNIAEAFAAGADCVMLENHGVVIGGRDLKDAFQRFETLECVAQTLVKAATLGEIRVLPAERLVERALPEPAVLAPAEPTNREKELRTQICRFVHRAYEQRLLISTAGSFSARLHAAIYQRHPEVGAVVNAQPVHASAFCMTAAVLSTHTIPESYVVLNEVPKLPHACVVAEAEGIAAQVSLGRHPAVLIENEGALVVGRDVLDAFDRLEVLEATAEALVLSRPLGPLVPMPDAAIDELRRVFGVP